MKGDIRFGGGKRPEKKSFLSMWRRKTSSPAVFDIAREQKQKSRKSRTRRGEIMILFAFFLLGAIMYAAQQPFTQYKDIGVSGTKGVSQADITGIAKSYINEKALGIIPRSSIFAFRSQKLAARIHEFDVRIRDARIDESIISHSIAIYITEYEPWVRWCRYNAADDSRGCGFLGDDGVLFAYTKEDGTIPSVYDERAVDEFMLGTIVLNDEWRAIINAWTAEGALEQEYSVRQFTLREDGSMRARTKEGWDVILDDSSDPAQSLANLHTSLTQEIKDKRLELEYVDVRFGNKVFYKFR